MCGGIPVEVIRIIGCFPVPTYIILRIGNGVARNKFATHVYVMQQEASTLAYVRVYEVHYRHPDTRRWSLLVSEAAGNCDALTEAVLDLRPFAASREGLFTQYLRIRPIVHHLRPTMRISVYGQAIPSIEPTRALKSRNRGAKIGGGQEDRADDIYIDRDDCDDFDTSDGEITLAMGPSGGVITADGVSDGGTVEYCVSRSVSKEQQRYVRDGLHRLYGRSSYRDDYHDEVKAIKRKLFYKVVQEERDYL